MHCSCINLKTKFCFNHRTLFTVTVIMIIYLAHNKRSYVVGHIVLLLSLDWKNACISFIYV